MIGELDGLRGDVFSIATIEGVDARIAKAQSISDRITKIYDSMAVSIPLDECKDGWLYRIQGRNCVYGIFVKRLKGFVYLREKFNRIYMDVEYHWDTGEPFGTCKAYCKVKYFGRFRSDFKACLTSDWTYKQRVFHHKVSAYLKKGDW